MTHLAGRHDRDLHLPDGTHRTTSVSTSGRAIALHEKRLARHLAEHSSPVKCDCMAEDPGDGFGERVVTHSMLCPQHPENDQE